jgi:hypothetical protein
LIACVKVSIGTVTTVKNVITTATDNSIIAGTAGDGVVTPIPMYLDIVTDKSSIGEV